MTDHEHKLDIIKKRFIQVGMETGLSEEESTEGTLELMKEEKFIQVMSYCMDAWAGVISARIDEDDEKAKN